MFVVIFYTYGALFAQFILLNSRLLTQAIQIVGKHETDSLNVDLTEILKTSYLSIPGTAALSVLFPSVGHDRCKILSHKTSVILQVVIECCCWVPPQASAMFWFLKK